MSILSHQVHQAFDGIYGRARNRALIAACILASGRSDIEIAAFCGSSLPTVAKVSREINEYRDRCLGIPTVSSAPSTKPLLSVVSMPASTTPVLTGDLADRVRELLDGGMKILAITEMRHALGIGLKEAKDAVEAIEHAA